MEDVTDLRMPSFLHSQVKGRRREHQIVSVTAHLPKPRLSLYFIFVHACLASRTVRAVSGWTLYQLVNSVTWMSTRGWPLSLISPVERSVAACYRQ